MTKDSISDHLLELRSRLLKVILLFAVFSVLGIPFASEIYLFVSAPLIELLPDGSTMIATEVASPFMAPIKLVLYIALMFSMPWLFYQTWMFMSPGLYKNEKKALLPYLIFTPILFLFGGLLVYYLIMPLAIKFFLSFESIGTNTSLPIQLEAKVNEYLSLIMRLIFAFGISFQLPVLLSLLARVGFIDSEYLKKRRKYVVVIIFAVAAILTPPDPITQIGLGIPLLILYELSILSVKFIEKKKKDA